MANPTMEVTNYYLPNQSKDLTQGHNHNLTDLNVLDPNLIRQPDYFVFVFSVADRDFEIHRPTLNVSTLYAKHNPNAMSDPTAYHLVWKVPSPYPLPYVDQNSGEVRLNTVQGERAAMDVCNPNQKSMNMDGYIAPDAEGNIGVGDDLIRKGLFFVKDSDCTYAKDDKDKKFPVPPAKLVADAVARKEKYYNGLLDKMKGFEYSSQADLEDYKKQEPDVHLACEYFGVETAWHQKRVRKAVKTECRLCGSEMMAGAPYHPLPGTKLGICINDWSRAIEAGVVSESDRPKIKG
jgi:hypothetical protein